MRTFTTRAKQLFMFALLFSSSLLVFSQEQSAEEAAKQANNPLAKVKAVNVQNYYLSSIYGAEGATANQTYIRYAQPIGRVLARASLPVVTTSSGNEYKSGLGDTQIFGAYLLSSPTSGNQIGVGPLLVLPTGTNHMGAEKWQAGLSFVAFMAANPQLQYGSLITWQMSFAGDGDRDVNQMGFQPFLMWQLGQGLYLRSAAMWTFDFEDSGVNIPMSLGIGKVVKSGSKVFNLFIEPQFTAYNHNYAGAKVQFFTGINLQF